MQLNSGTGTYILVLSNASKRNINVGKLGTLVLVKGYYLYVGSAFGPGGIKSRVSRHLKKQKKLRWHIDYLREKVAVEDVWVSYHPNKLECEWSRILGGQKGLGKMKGLVLHSGLGASDCDCDSHLYFFSQRPNLKHFLMLNSTEVSIESYGA